MNGMGIESRTDKLDGRSVYNPKAQLYLDNV